MHSCRHTIDQVYQVRWIYKKEKLLPDVSVTSLTGNARYSSDAKKWGSRVARKSLANCSQVTRELLASHARVARKSRASCPHVTRESLWSHTQTTRVIINCTTISSLYLYCYKPFVINITKEYYSVHFFLQPLPTNTRSPVIVIDWS